jgi:hypothetical protein
MAYSFPLSFLVMVIGLEGTGVCQSPDSLIWAMICNFPYHRQLSRRIHMYVSCAAEAKRHRVTAPVPLRGKAWAESIYFLLVLDEAAGSSLQAVVLGSACTRLFHSHLHVDFGSGSDCLTIFIYQDYT